jgi:hypothetical protein
MSRARRADLLASASLIVALSGLALTPLAGQPPAEGKKYALLVGVREYDSGKFAELRFTENDVEEMAHVLRDKAGFAGVAVLTTTRGRKSRADAPTRANIVRALASLTAKKRRQDTILIALSGHGMQQKVKEKDESFFCPSDAQLNDVGTMLSLGQLFADLDTCGAGVKLLLVDACRDEPASGRNLDLDALPRPTRGTAALFSCKSGERAFETDKLPGGKGHGVFFYHVLQGLKGEAANPRREVTWSSLTDYVAHEVGRAVPKVIGGGARQTPHEIKNIEGASPVLVRAAGGARAASGDEKQPSVKGGGVKEEGKERPAELREDFTRVRTGGVPEGWLPAEGPMLVQTHKARRCLAAARSGGPAISTPLLRIEGDFIVDVVFLQGGGNSLTLTLQGKGGGDDLELFIDNGYLAFLKLGGEKGERFTVSTDVRRPTGVRLEREGKTFRVIHLNERKELIARPFSKCKDFEAVKITLSAEGANRDNHSRVLAIGVGPRAPARKKE